MCKVDSFNAQLGYMLKPTRKENLSSKIKIRVVRVLLVYVSRDPATYIRRGRGQ